MTNGLTALQEQQIKKIGDRLAQAGYVEAYPDERRQDLCAYRRLDDPAFRVRILKQADDECAVSFEIVKPYGGVLNTLARLFSFASQDQKTESTVIPAHEFLQTYRDEKPLPHDGTLSLSYRDLALLFREPSCPSFHLDPGHSRGAYNTLTALVQPEPGENDNPAERLATWRRLVLAVPKLTSDNAEGHRALILRAYDSPDFGCIPATGPEEISMARFLKQMSEGEKGGILYRHINGVDHKDHPLSRVTGPTL